MSSNRDRLTKNYATEEIVVEWGPRLCYHSQNCVRSLPQVFDDSRRPWIKIDAATADEVADAVARAARPAPFGRAGLAPCRRSGRIRSSFPHRRTVRCSSPAACGILDAEGTLLYEGERTALCRCGGSANKPFCDGTHKKNGFRG
jgi:uncharacterized Fe-S cluster protein YjdI